MTKQEVKLFRDMEKYPGKKFKLESETEYTLTGPAIEGNTNSWDAVCELGCVHHIYPGQEVREVEEPASD
jgi:hypothetical protein